MSNLLKVKRRVGEGIFGVFVGCEYIGDVYFNGTTDIEVSDKMLTRMKYHKVPENALIDALEAEYSYINFYDEALEEDETIATGSEEYEDEELSIVDSAEYGDERELKNSIYEDAKRLSSKEIYGDYKVHKFKEDVKLPEFDSLNNPEKSPFNMYKWNNIDLKQPDGVYQSGGLLHDGLKKEIKRMEDRKYNLLSNLKNLSEKEKRFQVVDIDDKIKKINEQIISHKTCFLSATKQFAEMKDDIRKQFCVLRQEIESLEFLNGDVYRKILIKEEIDPLTSIFHEFE